MNEEKNVYEQSILLEPDNQVQVIFYFEYKLYYIILINFLKREKINDLAEDVFGWFVSNWLLL